MQVYLQLQRLFLCSTLPEGTSSGGLLHEGVLSCFAEVWLYISSRFLPTLQHYSGPSLALKFCGYRDLKEMLLCSHSMPGPPILRFTCPITDLQ